MESLLRDEISHEISPQIEIRLHVKNLQGLKHIVYGVIDALVKVEAGGIGIAFATNSSVLAGLIAETAGCSAMAAGAYLSTKSEIENIRKNLSVARTRVLRITWMVEMSTRPQKLRRMLVCFLYDFYGTINSFPLNPSIPLAILTSKTFSTSIISMLAIHTSTLSGTIFKNTRIEYLSITYSTGALTYSTR